MDYVTGLPTSHGQDALLTVTDLFSKAVKLIPCKKTTTAEDTATLFLHHCYTTFGLPTKIISDRDAHFTSKFWATLMKLLGVKMGITAAFHPAADGQSERTNQTVEIALRCFLGGDKDNYRRWTEYLPILEHEINSTPNVSTGFSPNELRFAIKPRGLADLFYPLEGTSDSAERLAEELKNKRDDARDSITVTQLKQRKYFNER
jgi:transposase InsO family protein